MGKEVKETPKVQEGELDIQQQIDQNVKMNSDVAKQAAEEIAKKNKERRVEEMKECLMKADYVRQYGLLTLRKSRDEEKADKEFLTTLTAIADELKEGKHDTTSYDKAFNEARKKKADAYRSASDKFDEYANKLNQNFSDWDVWRWGRMTSSNF